MACGFHGGLERVAHANRINVRSRAHMYTPVLIYIVLEMVTTWITLSRDVTRLWKMHAQASFDPPYASASANYKRVINIYIMHSLYSATIESLREKKDRKL